MGITFTRAPLVNKGDPITSTQFGLLADAFNDRLRSGLGDGPWRIAYYWLSLFRQVRNPDESGMLFPALAEFFTVGYQMLDPDKAEWPVAAAGQPEGANIACQIMAYVFGSETLNIYDEATRLTNPDPDSGGISLGPADTDEDLWELAKQQRGGYDPETGALGSPAWSAARSHHRFAFSNRSPHGNAYGGYLPTPEISEEICDPTDDGFTPINYLIHFTALKEGLEDKDYAGTCAPTGSNSYSSHVRWIGYTPWAYYVWLNGGTIEILPTTDYIEGPYTGEAQLRKTANGALPRVLNAFTGEYRGSDSQRDAADYWLDNAFDTQRFLTSQYHLAANIGTEDPETHEIIAEYPLYTFSGDTTLKAGTLATHVQSSTNEHAWEDSFVLSAFLVTATRLRLEATIELIDGDEVIATTTLTPDEFGYASALVTVDSVKPEALQARLKTDAVFTSIAGSIDVECNEILKQKPTVEDLFLLLRCGGAVGAENVTDGRGIDEDKAKEIGENYFSHACIENVHGNTELPPPDSTVNTNGLFDAARRLSQCIRIVPRQNFVGYEVKNGKSILYFKKNAMIGGRTISLFGGIAGKYKQTFDFDGVTQSSTEKHAYVGAHKHPTDLTPDELIHLSRPVVGFTPEEGTSFFTTEEGTILRSEDQPPSP